MKPFVKKSLMAVLSLGALSLIACGGEKSSSNEEKGDILNFVAVTQTSWDAETTIGKHKYTLGVAFQEGNKAVLTGTCTAQVVEQKGGGGSGRIRMDGPTETDDSTSVAEASSESPEELATHNFTKTGTWAEETGYGYTVTFDSKLYHVDFNKQEGRQEFYYTVATDEGSASVKFQAKDPDYRSKLAADYQIWDIRDAQYLFTAEVTGNNNSVALAYLYCHTDGSVIRNTANGSQREVSEIGTWALNGTEFSIAQDGKKVVADNSNNSSRQGYRISMDDATYFCSTNGVDYYSMSNEDFDGASLYRFESEDGNTIVSLVADGKAFIYNGMTVSKRGTYTFDNTSFVITFEGSDPITCTKAEDGSWSFEIVTIKNNGSSNTETRVTVTRTK